MRKNVTKWVLVAHVHARARPHAHCTGHMLTAHVHTHRRTQAWHMGHAGPGGIYYNNNYIIAVLILVRNG